jgi:NADH:ubiquinone oxidoreductase subunit 5 (subunit L)/multisubunit Na+/H+ antiporter MnhA subunit
MFHLFTHAFFKALLFLGSGSVIHAMHHEQDIRHMGGLKDRIPYTYIVMIVGTLALTGFPLTAGYFSKDAIIEAAYVGKNPVALYAFICTVAAALLTSFYSWRLIFKTFHGEPHDRQHWKDAHESPMVMLIPLGFLAVGSVLAGLPFKEIFAGHGVEGFFRESLTFAKGNSVLEDMHHVPLQIGILPTVMMALGFVIAWQFYIRRPDIPVELARQHDWLYRFLLNKWYFDELYGAVVVGGVLLLTRALRWIDETIVDGLVNGVASWTRAVVFGYGERARDSKRSGAAYLAIGGMLSAAAAWLVGASMWLPDQTAGSAALAIVTGCVCGGLTLFFFWGGAGSFDHYVVDGLVNGAAFVSGFFGRALRTVQTGKVQTYVAFVIVGVMVFFFFFR